MVGIVATSWGDRSAGIPCSSRLHGEIAAKLEQLRQLKEALLHCDPALLPELVPRLAELQADRAGPVRKALVEIIGEIGLKHVEFLPEVVPMLISFLEDETPAVARQAITTGTSLFQNMLVKVAIKGLHSSEIDDSLRSSWAWMLKFKDAVLPIAVQPGSDGVKLLAIKFVEAVILLYTPDPSGSSSPPHEAEVGFSVSLLKGGHPVLNLGDLATEAGQNLGLLLDQLRFPHVKSLSNSIVIVLINSLSAIAKKRPSFYGRILPVLLCLDPASSVIKGVRVPGAHHALKSAFVACLKCTHSSAAPWRARLIEALKAIDTGELGDQAVSSIPGGTSVNSAELPIKDDETSMLVCDEAHTDSGRKRYIVEENSDSPKSDVSGKRLRQTVIQETDRESLKVSSDSIRNDIPCNNAMASRPADTGPVQQLVSMFGMLVAQGDKAAQSLEILVSSISSDLLADVVMANMRHLPLACPKADNEEEVTSSLGYFSNPLNKNLSAMQPLGPPEDFSLSGALRLLTSLLNVQPSSYHNMDKSHRSSEEVVATVDVTVLSSSVNAVTATISTSIPAPVAPKTADTENASSAALYYTDDMHTVEGKIPGLESTGSLDEIQGSTDASHSSMDLEATGQENVLHSGIVLPTDVSSSLDMSSHVSEIPSPGLAVTDASQPPTSNTVISAQYVLPKMTVHDIDLADEQKDQLQKEAFVRILEAYKQIAVSAFSHSHFSLLAHLGIEFPLELASWGLLQKHILSDYLNHEGHELTLHVLYRLYREVEQDQDYLSSRTATSVYETFLLTVAETLRDTFPASDKSLSRLLAEVPYLSEGTFELLECLCSPESNDGDKDFANGDRVTQGLSAVWNLILLRPSSRDRCLQIALQSAVHQMEEVRMKAIRLVANKLFPMAIISQKIEDFANEKLQTVATDVPSIDNLDVDASILEPQKDSDVKRPSGGVSSSLANDELTSSLQNTSSSLISEAQRCMSLYFALCTKKHSLLRQIFSIFERLPKTAKQAVHRHIPILIRTIGSSPELLDIISDPPSGSESLLMQVIQTLTDGTIPSQDLISSIKRLYHFKMKDVEFLTPVLSFLPKEEIILLVPQFVNLPLDKFQASLTRLVQGSPQTGPSLSPAEILISIHGIDPEKDGVALKKIMDACSACFEQQQVFTQQVLAKVLNQLVEHIPLPLLFMRTVIQAIGVFPGLVDFVMEILSRLVSKQIWKYPKLWVGFLKCAVQTKPQSFNVLLQLPAAQLENALSRNPVLKSPLIEHANQPSIRSTLPRSTLVVLGLASDSQTPSQAQTSQGQPADTGSSAADVVTEVTQESTSVS